MLLGLDRSRREPDGGNLHVRFDEGEENGGHWSLCLSLRVLLSTLLVANNESLYLLLSALTKHWGDSGFLRELNPVQPLIEVGAFIRKLDEFARSRN